MESNFIIGVDKIEPYVEMKSLCNTGDDELLGYSNWLLPIMGVV